MMLRHASRVLLRPQVPRAAGSVARALSGSSGSGSGSEDPDDDSRDFGGLQRTNSIHSGIEMNQGRSGSEEEMHKWEETLMNSLAVSGDVHGSYLVNASTWRKRPLFKRAGHLTFTSGREAAELLLDEARRRDKYQVDFLQCVEEVATDIAVVMEKVPKLAWVFKQVMEPERLVTFRVSWTDRMGNERINRGYRVQYSSALGPYHGGLRFDPHLSHGTLRMLGWEQTLKNAVTGLALGGSRGGSDFNPANKTAEEIKSFCQSFVEGLAPYIGPGKDTVETDLGVGKDVMAALHASYVASALGEGEEAGRFLFGGCEVFPEASGFGCVYFAERALEAALGESLQGKKCLLSGTGTLARSVALKLLAKGAVPVTFSNATGYVHKESGFSAADIDFLGAVVKRKGSLSKDFAERDADCVFVKHGSPWEQAKGQLAFPCRVQGDVNAEEAAALADNGCLAIFEGADRACAPLAIDVLQSKHVLFAPSKAVNCGSVVASAHLAEVGHHEPKEALDAALQTSMVAVHDSIVATAERYGVPGNLRAGANLAAFLRIANSKMYTTRNK